MIVKFKKPTREFYMLLGLVGGVVIVSLIGTSISKAKNEFKTANNPEKAKEVALSLKEEVGKIFKLPSDDPVIATVTDKKDLPQDAFYAQAENGDKILLFETSRKVILYRPGEKRVIDVGALESAPTPPPIEAVAGESTSTDAATLQTVPRILFQSQNP